MADFNSQWTAETAIMEMYLADLLEADEWNGYRARFQQMIADALHEVGHAENRAALADKNERQAEKTISTVVRSIRSVAPGFTSDSTLHPVLWMRLAHESVEVPLSDLFIERFGEWRANVAAKGLTVMLYQASAGKKWRGRNWTPAGRKAINGFTFDDVILGRAMKVNPYQVTWKTKDIPWSKSGSKKQNVRLTAPVLDTASPPQHTVKRQSRKNVVNALTQAVRKAIRSKSIAGLAKQSNGRYTSEMSRPDLIKQLIKQSPQLKHDYTNSTLTRKVPEVVQCPRGRPGGLRA